MRPLPLRQVAFTLVEVLVVVTIIAILSAIVFPVYSTVRKRAQEMNCLSNLRQIGVATNLYISDYDDSYPYSIGAYYRKNFGVIMVNYNMSEEQVRQISTFEEALYPYLKQDSIFSCPLDVGSKEELPLFGGKVAPSLFKVLGSSYLSQIFLRREHPGCVIAPANMGLAHDLMPEWHSAPNTYHDAFRSCQVFLDGHASCGTVRQGVPNLSFTSPCDSKRKF